MTLAMPDSIRVNDLPPGYPAYLGYADGQWPTAQALAERFPTAHRVILTVTGTHFEADGIDIEPGNPSARDAAFWAEAKFTRQPGFRPVLYASVIGEPGYGMGEVLAELAARGIDRGRVRLLSAHYGAGEHICGPRTCGEISTDMDGTQWTNAARGLGGSVIDMSALRDDFFTGSTVLNWTEKMVRELPVVWQGMTGEAVRTVQGLCVARGWTSLVVDGVFGSRTEAAVRSEQMRGRVAVDGVVGPQTWPVLLGIA